MSRFIRATEGLRARFRNWWTAHIERPSSELGDVHMRRKDRVLTWIFRGNPPGRLVYRLMSANAWTWLRLFCSPIPMTLIIMDRILAACVSFVLIGLTDLFDGWFARDKYQVTEWGKWFETRVDWVYLLLTFIGVFVRYPDMRSSMVVAGALEIVRATGGTHLRRAGYNPDPNKSGRWKMPFIIGGIGFRFIHDLVTDIPSVPATLATPILLACYACMMTGIVLSAYSLLMHWCAYRAWKRNKSAE